VGGNKKYMAQRGQNRISYLNKICERVNSEVALCHALEYALLFISNYEIVLFIDLNS
jgi:hypothetical protein